MSTFYFHQVNITHFSTIKSLCCFQHENAHSSVINENHLYLHHPLPVISGICCTLSDHFRNIRLIIGKHLYLHSHCIFLFPFKFLLAAFYHNFRPFHIKTVFHSCQNPGFINGIRNLLILIACFLLLFIIDGHFIHLFRIVLLLHTSRFYEVKRLIPLFLQLLP